jgi:hypothetical protein
MFISPRPRHPRQGLTTRGPGDLAVGCERTSQEALGWRYRVTLYQVIRGNFKLTLAPLWSVAYRRMVEAGMSYAQVSALRLPVAPDRKR